MLSCVYGVESIGFVYFWFVYREFSECTDLEVAKEKEVDSRSVTLCLL